jgi:hypothetical protein
MYDISNEDFEDFIKRNIDNLHNAFKVNAYEELVQWNRYIISHIRYIVSGHLIAILMNKNYYYILNKLHQVTVTIKGGRFEINNFAVLLGVDDDKNLDQSIHVFTCDIYDGNKLILPFIAKIKYDDSSTASILSIESELLYEKLYIDDYRLEDLIDNDNMTKLREEAVAKNDMLTCLANILDKLIDPSETPELIDRLVMYYKEGGEDKDEE